MWKFCNWTRKALSLAKAQAANSTADKGFILVLVLWSAIFLALLAAGFAASVRTHIRATASASELARAEAVADGGINLAVLDLLGAHQNTGVENRFPAGASATGCQASDGALMFIRVEDEAGKINLNLASEELLSRFFIGLGAAPDQASTYAGSVLDFRDSDDDARPNGAERDVYAAAGQRSPPKNGLFDTVDELDQVLGLPPELISRAKTYATVHSGVTGFDETVSPPELIALLDAAALQSATGGVDGGAPFRSRSMKKAFSIYALARMPSGVQYVAHAIVEFPFRAEQSYALRQWRRGNAGDARQWVVGDQAGLPPC
jgi:general secretion pathway protein K